MDCFKFEMVFVLQNLLSKIYNRGWKREEVRKYKKSKHVQIINIKLTFLFFRSFKGNVQLKELLICISVISTSLLNKADLSPWYNVKL